MVTKKKKKEPVGIASTITESTPSVAATPRVMPVTGDFGREDLNALRDKINEIVAVINSL